MAVITGADSGIGRAVAIAYAREGADVLISYLNEDSDAEEVTELRRAGRPQGCAGRRAICRRRSTAATSSIPRSVSSVVSTSWSATPRSR